MHLFDLNTVRALMDADPEVVRQVLVSGHWQHGPIDDPEAFATWLQQRSYEDHDIDESDRLLVLAINYYTRRHPDTSHLLIASIACTVQEFTVGWHSYPTEEQCPTEAYAKRLIMAAIGGSLDESAEFGTVPEWAVFGAPAPGLDPEALTHLLLRLLEAIYFYPPPKTGE